jgi:outer membrane protein
METLFWIITLVASSLSFSSEIPLSLSEAYSKAVSHTEMVPVREEEIRQAEEKYRQAIGNILPAVTGYASYTWQAAAGGGAFSPTEQPLVKINATQPLFRGLREFAALKQTSLLGQASEQGKQVALRQLFNDVTQTFYTVLSLEQDIVNLQSQIGALERRIQDLKQRIKIGRSRLTEVLTVQASLSSLRAQLFQTKGQLQVAKETFSYVTGETGNFSLSDTLQVQNKISPLNVYMDSLAKRPELKMKQLQYEASDKGVSIAKGAHLPSIDLNGNYYFKRFGFFNNIPWDIGVSLSLPILNGGILSSRVEEASSQRMQAELELKRAKRAALQEIQSLYATFKADLEQISELNSARDLTEKNFVQQNREYRNGLVSNLEVLQALTAFEESKRSLDRAKFQSKIDYLKLEASVGSIPEATTSPSARKESQ